MDNDNLSKNNKAILIAVEKGYKVIRGILYNKENKSLKPELHKHKDGYQCFRYKIHCGGGIGDVKITIHRLVAYQKYGDIIFDSKIHVRHKDCNPFNNNEDNILIGSAKDNYADVSQERRLIQYKNRSNRMLRFNQKEMESILEDLKTSSMKELSLKYNVSYSVIWKIKSGKYKFKSLEK